jgi:hypothetical protein
MLLHIIPVVGTIGYLYYPTHLRLHPNILFYITLIHNAGLIAFSAWTFLSMTNILLANGVVFQSNYYFSNPEFDRVVFYFYLSKYYEYTDTFLLYLGGKKPIFLQKYHHVGTAILWHFAYYYKGDAIWIPTFYNSFVHTIMYSYYLGCLLKFQSFKAGKPYITGLQIFQLVSQFSTLYYYKPPVDTEFNYWIAIISNIFTLGLLFLFCQFYYTNYRVPKLREH